MRKNIELRPLHTLSLKGAIYVYKYIFKKNIQYNWLAFISI